jgi:CheY-like chemotaxis protein
MTVESRLGEGTTFRIYLPASDEPVLPKEEESDGRKKLWKGQGLLLVVDDEPSVLRVADSMLRRLGFDTILAHDGREATDCFRKRKKEIDAILLDMSMPTMDGLETLKALRKMQPDVRVILSTGYSRQMAAERFVGENFSAFLNKPFELSAVSEVLETTFA